MKDGQRAAIMKEIMEDVPPIRGMGEDGEYLGITASEYSKLAGFSDKYAHTKLQKMEEEGKLESRIERSPIKKRKARIYYKVGEMPK